MQKYGILVLALLGFAGHCHKSGLEPASKIFQLAVVDTSGNVLSTIDVPADNYTYAIIRAHTDSSVIDTTTAFSFTTDNGSFSTGGTSASSKIDIHGNAYAYLKSKAVLNAHVQATVGGNYSQYITIPFTTSYPDTLYLNLPDSATDDLAGRITFTTTLYKYFGSISPGLAVVFNATTAAGASIGTFTHVLPSDTTGTVNAEYWLDNATYTGFIYINAYLVTSTKDSIKTSGMMLITH